MFHAVFRTLKGHRDVVFRCTFSTEMTDDNNSILYSCSADGTVMSWDWFCGVRLSDYMSHNCGVVGIDFLDASEDHTITRVSL